MPGNNKKVVCGTYYSIQLLAITQKFWTADLDISQTLKWQSMAVWVKFLKCQIAHNYDYCTGMAIYSLIKPMAIFFSWNVWFCFELAMALLKHTVSRILTVMFVFQLLLEMPYNRNLESEADEVGLQMAAKVTYHVIH